MILTLKVRLAKGEVQDLELKFISNQEFGPAELDDLLMQSSVWLKSAAEKAAEVQAAAEKAAAEKTAAKEAAKAAVRQTGRRRANHPIPGSREPPKTPPSGCLAKVGKAADSYRTHLSRSRRSGTLPGGCAVR